MLSSELQNLTTPLVLMSYHHIRSDRQINQSQRYFHLQSHQQIFSRSYEAGLLFSHHRLQALNISFTSSPPPPPPPPHPPLLPWLS